MRCGRYIGHRMATGARHGCQGRGRVRRLLHFATRLVYPDGSTQKSALLAVFGGRLRKRVWGWHIACSKVDRAFASLGFVLIFCLLA
jgi:hypothetical protein